MRNQRGRNPSLVVVVLILAEGDVVEVGPAFPDEDVGVGVARVLALVAPLDPGLGVTSVVGKKENQSILEFVPLTEGVYQLTHILVDLFDHGGIDRHHVIVTRLLLFAERRPGGNILRADFGFPVLVDQAGLHLTGMTFPGQRIPAPAVFTTIFRNCGFRSHAGKVRRNMGKIPEERLLGGPGLVEKLNALLGPEIRAIPGRREPGIIARNSFSIEVEAAAGHPAGLIPEMNTSQIEIQAAKKASGGGIDGGGVSHMPFSRDGGQVAGFAEDLRDSVAVVVQGTPVTGDALVGGHPAYSGLVGIQAG